MQGAGRASKTASDIHTQTLRSGFDLSVRMKSGKGPFAHLVRDRASFRRGGAPKRPVGDALGYLYFSLRGEDVPAWCDTVFSGEGETVPKAQIDAIGWL